MEESDDEFPDLANICARKTAILVNKSASRPRQTVNDESQDSRTKEDEGPGKKPKSFAQTNSKEDDEFGRPRPRKRILNKTLDNPLLRPIASKNSEYSESSGNSCSKAAFTSERPTRRRAAVAKQSSVSKTVSDLEEDDFEPLTLPRGKETRKGREKKTTTKQVIIDPSSDVGDPEDSSDLSDFIVSDGSLLEEESVITLPSMSVRKLERGRRWMPNFGDSDSEDLGREMAKLRVGEDDASRDPGKLPLRNAETLSSDLDDPFTLS